MIHLEPFTEKDIQRLISWIDDKESLLLFGGTFFTYPLTRKQLINYLKENRRTVFRVKETRSGKIIGHAEMLRVEKNVIRLCRILIGEKDFRGRGYGEELVKQLLKRAFEFQEVEQVELNVYEQNHAAKRCYEKAGFVPNPLKNKTTAVADVKWLSLNMVRRRFL